MKKLYFILGLLFAFTGIAQAQLIISQFYFGSRDGDAPYQETYLQVYNNSDQAINLNDWYLLHTRTTNLGAVTATRQFGQTKAGATQNNYRFPDVILPARSFFLIGGSRVNMIKAEHLQMPYYPDHVFENFETQIQHGILVLSKSDVAINADSLFYEKPLTMARVSDMLIYGTMTRYGAPLATNPDILFANQAPVLGIITAPADKQWKFVRKLNEQNQYSVTGKSSDDFDRIKAIEKPAQSRSGKKYLAYEEFFFKFYNPQVASNTALTGTNAIADYLNSWSGNEHVYWEYDHNDDTKNRVLDGLQMGSATQAGWAQTPFFRIDKDSAYLFRAQIMPFSVSANDRKQIAMEVLSEGRVVIDTIISIMDAESNKWYTVWLPLPKLDSVSFKFKNTVVNQAVVDRYGLKDIKLYADTRTAEVPTMMKIREAVALSSDSALMINKDRLVRIEGVVQSRNFSSTGTPEFVIADSTGYIRVVDNFRRTIQTGSQVFITGTLGQSSGLPRIATLTNFLVSENSPVAMAGHSTVIMPNKTHVNKPIQMAILTCVDTLMPITGNAERLIRFTNTAGDTIKVYFSRNYCQSKATPAKGSTFSLIKGFGYISQSAAPFTQYGMVINDSNDLRVNAFDSIKSFAILNNEGRPTRKGDYIVTQVKVESKSLRSDANANYIISDGTGFFSAYHLNTIYTPITGDEILIMGKVDEFNKQTQLSDVTFISLIGSGRSTSAFNKITAMLPSAINSPARFDTLEYVSGYATPIGSGKTLKFAKGTDTFAIRLTQAFGIDTFGVAPVAGERYNVRGYIGRNYEVMQLLVPSASFFTKVVESTRKAAEIDAVAVQLWPNPSKDGRSTVSFAKSADRQIWISNSMGHVVERFSSSAAQVEINLSGQPSGMYYITVIEAGQSQTIKFIRQ